MAAPLTKAEKKRRLDLVPNALASAREREALDADTLTKAVEVKAKAKAVKHLKLVTDESWVEHRHGIGKDEDREAALMLIMAATGYRPLPAQEQFHLARAPFEPANDNACDAGVNSFRPDSDTADRRVDKFYCGGIGTGKSYCAIVDDLIAIIMNPGVRGLIVAPTYDQCLHVLLPTFLHFCELMERAGYPILKRFRWSQMRAELVCGGEVFFRSAGKIDNLLGFQFAWVHLDESETLANPELIWNTLSGRVRQKAHVCQMIATSTPRGLRGVLGIFQAARESYKSEAERIRLRDQFFFVRSTTLENPHLPKHYIDNLRRTLSRQQWDQEVLAKVLRPEAAVYNEFERARHEYKVASRAAFIARLKELGVPYDIAYDPGQTYAHVLWIARFIECDVIFDEVCDDGITIDRLHAEIVQRCAALGRPPDWIVCDRAVKRERAWAAETFPQSSVMIMDSRSEQSIAEGISIVKNLLDPMMGEPRLRLASYLWDRMPRRAIVRCFMGYRYGQQANGLLTRLPHRDNWSDHGMDSTRMWCVKRHGDAYRFLVVQRRMAA